MITEPTTQTTKCSNDFFPSRLGEGQEKWSDTPSKVFHLTKETFSDFLSQRSNVLVMFYAPWCPHCKKAKPEYQAAAEVLSQDTNNKYLAAVDCTDTQGMCGDGYTRYVW